MTQLFYLVPRSQVSRCLPLLWSRVVQSRDVKSCVFSRPALALKSLHMAVSLCVSMVDLQMTRGWRHQVDLVTPVLGETTWRWHWTSCRPALWLGSCRLHMQWAALRPSATGSRARLRWLISNRTIHHYNAYVKHVSLGQKYWWLLCYSAHSVKTCFERWPWLLAMIGLSVVNMENILT